jgi:ubiquinone/menaquinone biosynthesis C-methylase UbiE
MNRNRVGQRDDSQMNGGKVINYVDKNKYQQTSHLYDLDERGIVKDDIPFYIEYAKQTGGPILEVACGTGRVTLPLARAGYSITGFDLSTNMLSQLRSKLQAEQEVTKGRVEIFQADMTNFHFGKRFPLILIPFRAFQLLIDNKQQVDCLVRIKDHLTEDGIFIMNVFKPYSILDESWVRPEVEDWSILDPKTGLKVRRTHIRRKIDITKQVTYPELKYYVEDDEGKENCFVEKLAMKYYYEEQLRNLLIRNGFIINDQFGYYDKRSIDDGPELIFVCKKM